MCAIHAGWTEQCLLTCKWLPHFLSITDKNSTVAWNFIRNYYVQTCVFGCETWLVEAIRGGGGKSGSSGALLTLKVYTREKDLFKRSGYSFVSWTAYSNDIVLRKLSGRDGLQSVALCPHEIMNSHECQWSYPTFVVSYHDRH